MESFYKESLFRLYLPATSSFSDVAYATEHKSISNEGMNVLQAGNPCRGVVSSHARVENRWFKTSDSLAKVFLLIRLEHAVIKFYRLLLATLPPSPPNADARPRGAGRRRGQAGLGSIRLRGRRTPRRRRGPCHAAMQPPTRH